MSSFVVNKEEYIKAAGIVAGIAEAKNGGSLDRFWIYDYERGHNMTAADYYDRFAECYTMNALSVQEQYHDDMPERDDCDYMDTFTSYKDKAKRLIMQPEKLKNIILDLHRFFRCAEYQTEKEAYFWKMTTFFNRITNQLLPLMAPAREECGWGSLEL